MLLQTLFAENKEKLINATLAALLDREGDQTSVSADELEGQFHAMRRLVASKAGFGAFMSLPQWVAGFVHKSVKSVDQSSFVYVCLYWMSLLLIHWF